MRAKSRSASPSIGLIDCLPVRPPARLWPPIGTFGSFGFGFGFLFPQSCLPWRRHRPRGSSNSSLHPSSPSSLWPRQHLVDLKSCFATLASPSCCVASLESDIIPHTNKAVEVIITMLLSNSGIELSGMRKEKTRMSTQQGMSIERATATTTKRMTAAWGAGRRRTAPTIKATMTMAIPVKAAIRQSQMQRAHQKQCRLHTPPARPTAAEPGRAD